MNTIRICVCGDEGVGKSSLISCFVKNHFVSGRIQSVLPQINLPPSLGVPGDNVSTSIIDTSPSPTERTSLNREIQKSNVILLVYSDNYSYERVGLFWMPHFRSLGVNVPVVLCANKSDLSSSHAAQVIEDEMLPLMNEFKELDACIRTSARERTNINEVFYLCQKAVTHPIAPLFDSKELALKPAAVTALQRIFYLSDSDQDGYLNDREMLAFQQKCFGKTLSEEELHNIKQSLIQVEETAASEKGVTSSGFLLLNRLFAEKGRHETIWLILRTFHYTDSLSLKDSFLYPKFDVPPFASAELSPAGYQFLFDLFLLFDKDNDGGLNSSELAALFAPTPGLPISWSDAGFPATTLRNESGHVTLQGWLAQWSMTTFTEPRTTLAYLAYFGFESSLQSAAGTVAALKVTKARKRRRRPPRVDRNVLHAYIVGAPGAGKSALLDAFLALPFSQDYHPGIKPRVAVNSVELPGGKQVYLILEELGELEHAILSHPSKLDTTDLLVYTYDSSDSDSFSHIAAVFEKHDGLNSPLLPSIILGLKADLDKATQRSERQPDVFAEEKGLTKPRFTSARWESVSEVFVQIAEAALNPVGVIPRVKGEEKSEDRSALYIAGAVGVVVLAAGWMIWRRVGRGE